jgi:hypothetical protein
MLRAKGGSLGARGRRASSAGLAAAGAVVFALWLATLLASDAPWLVITAFWLAAGGAIAFWAHRDVARHGREVQAMVQGLESALRRDTADAYDVRASAFAEFEEIEDEGACYAFEMEGGRLAFISGQEFYEASRFPSLDFALVYILDERDRAVDMVIDKRGTRAMPARRIPSAVKEELDMPEHLELREGTLDDLERLLAQPGRAGE